MSSNTGEDDKLSSTSANTSHQFSLADIQSATDGFADELIIGAGGFGKVYRGCISINETSHVVAIKRLDSMSNQGAPEFRAEIEMLSMLRHCHLVSLIGYCNDNKEMILVYEYMPNGTLYHHLHKSETCLNWFQRMKIAIGAARGLDYLHTGVGTKHGVIHRDVKSSNILLDESWEAMISDFGLSKIGPTNQSSSYVDASVKGTFGYLDPEYLYTRKLTRKTDVYAFGVVLFELLSGRLPVDERYGEEQCSLVRWAQKCVKERKLDQVADINMRGTISPKCLRRFAHLADRCLGSVLKERPTMTEVVASLQALLELQQKYDDSAASPGMKGLTSAMNKYFGFATKGNSDHVGTSNNSGDGKDHVGTSDNSGDGKDHVGTSNNSGDNAIRMEDLKLFTYDELKIAARGFGYQTCLGDWYYGKIYKGWVDENTYFPSELDTGLAVVIKTFHPNRSESFTNSQDFNVKLSDYNVWSFGPRYIEESDCCYHTKYWHFAPLYNLDYLTAFSWVMVEMLTTKPGFVRNDLCTNASSIHQKGPEQPYSDLAINILKSCNEEDSELKFLKIVNKLKRNRKK